MKLTTTMFLTLDGVYQAPGAPDEDTSDGFDQGGWQYPYLDQVMGEVIDQWFAGADAFLLGRRTYEIFAAYWPLHNDPDNPIATKLNELPKYVASRQDLQPGWRHSSVLRGQLSDAVTELKSRPGRELQVHGSGALVRALHDLGLIDEYRMLISPVVLGAGKRLFGGGSAPSALRLVRSRTTSTGSIAAEYQPAGQPTYGSIPDGG